MAHGDDLVLPVRLERKGALELEDRRIAFQVEVVPLDLLRLEDAVDNDFHVGRGRSAGIARNDDLAVVLVHVAARFTSFPIGGKDSTSCERKPIWLLPSMTSNRCWPSWTCVTSAMSKPSRDVTDRADEPSTRMFAGADPAAVLSHVTRTTFPSVGSANFTWMASMVGAGPACARAERVHGEEEGEECRFHGGILSRVEPDWNACSGRTGGEREREGERVRKRIMGSSRSLSGSRCPGRFPPCPGCPAAPR